MKPATTDIFGSQEAYSQTSLGKFDGRFLQARGLRITMLVLGLVILIVPAVQFVDEIQEVKKSVVREGGERHRTALGRWIPTAEVLATEGGEVDPYGFGHWFPLPPFILMSLIPLAKLGYVGAALVWAGLKIVGVVAAVALLSRALRRDDFAVPAGVLLMAVIFAFRPIVSDFQHGNINTFFMVYLALAWVLYMLGRDLWAGLLLSLAIVTKITPALVLVYFLYKRAWKVCLGTVVGLPIVFLLVPGLYVGFAENLELLRSWFAMLVAPYAFEGYVAFDPSKPGQNQALYAVLLRLGYLSELIAIESMPFEETVKAGIEGMIRPENPWVRLVRPALSLSVVGTLAWLCRSRPRSRQDVRLLLEFSLVLIAMLLLSERTWKHHATCLIIVYIGVWYALACLPWSNKFTAWFVVGLVLQWLTLVGSTVGPDVLMEGGVFCFGLVLCFVQLAILLRRLQRPRTIEDT